MEMPERVKINNDNSLELQLDDIAGGFTISKAQYFKSDRGKILLKHQVIMQLADLLNIEVGPPVLIHTHNPIVYVISRTATLGNRSCTEIGESNSKNLYDEIMRINPASTADNRAYDRAVLKLLKIYGEVYGASEMNYKDEKTSPAASKKEPKQHKDSEGKAASEKQPETEAVPIQSGTDKNDGKLPFWWNDTGLGVFKESELNPDAVIVTQGPCAGKNWTIKQLYDYQYNSCVYFAERRSLDSADTDFKKQVYACRRAIRKYGIKE